MSFVDSILFALALCVDSLIVSTTCSLKCKMTFRRGLLLALTFAFFQGFFPLIGALLGGAFKEVISAVDHWIAFALLALTGLKMIWDALRGDDGDGRFDVSRFGVIVALAVATSIDAFVVGIGLGLNNTLPQILFTVLIVAVMTFLAAMMGVFLGKHNVLIPEKWAGAIAGIVLMGLGVKTLLEHGALG
ncbi:MAG: manganese efflux pump MntP family protein [Bacteroidales bacterium]|nr:manganese efflux pump MntP family protein [Bacteroidales bacterium]